MFIEKSTFYNVFLYLCLVILLFDKYLSHSICLNRHVLTELYGSWLLSQSRESIILWFNIGKRFKSL